MTETTFPQDEAIVLSFPALVKASVGESGRRIISFQASNEDLDGEGDVVLQSSLLNAAAGFLRSGVIDIDHMSEIGGRYGISNPLDFIVGVPTEVKDMGNGRTDVIGELHQPKPGIVSKADQVWESLLRDPPVRWRASIYGFPTGPNGFIDARVYKCAEAPHAKRYVVKSLNWKSIALTKSPINDSITGAAHIVTAKAWIKSLQSIGMLGEIMDDPTAKEVKKDASPAPVAIPSNGSPANLLHPRNRMELLSHHTHHIEKGQCPFSGEASPLGKSVASFRDHFMGCVGSDAGTADILGLALMHALRNERK